jgi:competence protein ComEC
MHTFAGPTSDGIRPTPSVRRAPAVPAAIGMLVGVAAQGVAPALVVAWLVVFGSLTCLAAGPLRRRPVLATATLCLAWVVAGLLAGQLAGLYYPPDHVGHYASDDSRLAQVELSLDDPPRVITNPFDQRPAAPPKQVALARAVRVRTTDGWQDCSGDLLLQISEPNPNLAAGQRVRATGMLQRPAPAMNPGQFDWAAYYRDRRVLASLSVGHAASLVVLADAGPTPLTAARQEARRLLAEGFPPDRSLDHALLRALLLGDNDPQLRDVQDQFQKTGTAHHLAISGTHIAVVGGILWFVLRLVGAKPRRAALVVLAVVLGYGLLALPSAPVVRSVVLAVAFCLGLTGGRRGNGLQLLAFSVVAMLVFHPPDLFNAGFQLSFGTLLGLVLFSRQALVGLQTMRGWNDPDAVVMRSFEHPSAARRAWDHVNLVLLEALAAGLVAWLVSMPLIAYHFEQLNPWAIVAGIVLAPVVFVALVGGLLKVVLTLLWPWQAAAWASLAVGPVAGMRRTVEWLATWPSADVPVPPSPWWLIALFYGLLLVGLVRPIPTSLRWVLRGARVVAALFIVVPSWQAVVNPAVPAGTTRVTLLAVGAGQCAVVQPPGGRTVMLDAGSASLADLLGKCVGPFLRHARCAGVDTLVLSHADQDHVSAAAEVVKAYGVREVLTGSRFTDHAGDQTAGLIGELRRLERPPRVLLPGEVNPLGRDTTIEVLWPPPLATTPSASSPPAASAPPAAKPAKGSRASAAAAKPPTGRDSNDGCLVFKLTHGDRSILFPGDIQDGAMRELLKEPARLKADVLVAMHHGSAESLTKTFVDAVDPRYIVASNDRTLTAKQRAFDRAVAGRPLLRTHECGAIVITMDREGNLAVEPFVKRQ